MLLADMAGWDDIKDYFRKSLLHDNVSHSYIFEGDENTKKYDMAIWFAKSLLCTNFEEEPCDKCEACIKVNSFNHPDLHIISCDSFEKRSVGKDMIVEELIESIHRKPYQSDKKIYIISNSEKMTISAQNTFLKTLEEPIGNTVIIMLTENQELLLPTIRSRCQLIKFKRADQKYIKEYLLKNYSIDEEKACLASYYCFGDIDKAKDIIEGKDNIISKRTKLLDIFDDLLRKDRNSIFKYEEYFETNKDIIDEIVNLLMIWLRDVSYYKYNLNSFIINSDCTAYLKKHAALLGIENINNMIAALQHAVNNNKNSVNYKLIIDNLIIELQEEVIND